MRAGFRFVAGALVGVALGVSNAHANLSVPPGTPWTFTGTTVS